MLEGPRRIIPSKGMIGHLFGGLSLPLSLFYFNHLFCSAPSIIICNPVHDLCLLGIDLEQYLESPEVKGLAKSTRELYGHALKHFKEFCLASNVYEMEHAALGLASFAMYLERKKLSGKSIQQYLTCTKIFLKWAGHPVDFTYKISNKARQENKRKHLDRWFTEDEIEKCLAYPFNNVNGDSLKYRAIVRLLVETGARVGEVAGIRPEDINLNERWIFIQGKTEPRPVFFSKETEKMLKVILGGNIDCLFCEDYAPGLFPEVSKIKAAITNMLQDLGLKNGKDIDSHHSPLILTTLRGSSPGG